MGVRFPSVFANKIGQGLSLVTTAETLIDTTPALSPPIDGAAVFIFWYVKLVLGTGITGLTYKLYRGATLSGTVLTDQFQDQGGLGGGNEVTRSGVWVDTPGNVAGVQYTLSLTQTGATANGAAHEWSFIAMVL